jgi:hypothetical protein
MTSRLRVIVTGLIAQHPLMAGVTWDYLQFAVGLDRLGHDVYYFEDSGEWPYAGKDQSALDCSANIAHLAGVMSRFDLGDRWAYRCPITSEWSGLREEVRKSVIQSADLLVNVSGTLERPEEYRRTGRLAYIDSDPVFTQIKLARGHEAFRRRVEAHDVLFSFGECLSDAWPSPGYRWRRTRQPILLSEWRPEQRGREAFTTVMNWTSYAPLEFQGRTYGQKDLELRRFLDLPTRVRTPVLEVALWQFRQSAMAGEESKDRTPTPREVLARAGWQVVNPFEACYDIDSYRSYVETSKAEWSVAKNGYVQGKSGWFSCRSACYLAAGRPVVVQDTGFSTVLPTGEGILPFATVEQAIAAIRAVECDYSRHARAARRIAEEYFDSAKVLSRLIEQAYSCDTDLVRNREDRAVDG